MVTSPSHPDSSSTHTIAQTNPSYSPQSGSAIIFRSGEETLIRPVSRVLSSLHRSDLLILSSQTPPLPSLPLSPYPARPDTPVRAHFVTDQEPIDSGWSHGYMPGTYDALSHLLFTPPPTAGSSGGPIVDEESGAVIGVMLGTRVDNRVEGLRGSGVPSEVIFEMFSLPGISK
ncbi:hypothetical protein BD410DRAFT_824260 [Rickenella mellea]|uniref:Trypsin-like serine protease n=1 Tax=Rickenella mellea TaxID=50990 RepID=A0A4Y7QNS9_9AGAM|nr:hypothetical protein BD410DRAFT_824260 [Rickenella mellea]